MNCRKLKDQLDILEKETTDKLTQMELYNKELKVSVQFGPLQTHSTCTLEEKTLLWILTRWLFSVIHQNVKPILRLKLGFSHPDII